MYSITTTLPLDEVTMHIKAWMNKHQGWTLNASDEKSMSFNRTRKPDVIVTIFLLLLWVFPGILYLIFGWRKETCNFFFSRQEKKIQVLLESGRNTTNSNGKSLAAYLSSFDPALEVPPTPPVEKGFADYFLYVLYGGIALVVVGLIVVLLFQ